MKEKTTMKNTFSLSLMLLLVAQVTFGVDMLQQLDESEILEVSYMKSDNCIGYHATLNNGDTVIADSFVKGPLKDKYMCIRIVKSSTNDIIYLNNNVYGQLRDLYESQRK